MCFLHINGYHRAPPSSPTRRSSDLAAIANAQTDLGYKKSSNVTAVVVHGVDAAGTAAVPNSTAGFCVSVTSGSGSIFYYHNSTRLISSHANPSYHLLNVKNTA